METIKFSTQRSVMIDGDCADLVMISQGNDWEIQTVRSGRNFENAIGGVRFVSQGSLVEAYRLARGMREKCLSAMVPVDGCKTLVITPNGIPDEDRRAKLLAQHIERCTPIDRGIIFGPDMGSPELVMGKILENLNMKYENVTGLPKEYGGLDIDVNGFTAYGMFHAIRRVYKNQLDKTVTIQGFGAVGSKLAGMLSSAGFKIKAVSNVMGCLVCEDGLDIKKLYSLYERAGDECLLKYDADDTKHHKDPHHLFTVKADVFVPAARTSVLVLKKELESVKNENPDAISIEEFLAATGVSLIGEAANHPLSYSAEAYAEKRGVIVLPDFVVNCGGMIGCYTEWKHRRELLSKLKSYDDVVQLCNKHIYETIIGNLDLMLSEKSTGLRASGEKLMNYNLDKLKMS